MKNIRKISLPRKKYKNYNTQIHFFSLTRNTGINDCQPTSKIIENELAVH